MEKFVKTASPGESTLEWASRFYAAARLSGQLYKAEDEGLIYVAPGAAPKRLLDAQAFFGAAHVIVDIIQQREGPHGNYFQMVFLTGSEAQVLYDYHKTADLQVVRTIAGAPAALPCQDGTFQATHLGYNPQGGFNVLYYVPPGGEAITPLDGVQHLRECFAGVPFETETYRNNLFAWLLGAVVLDPKMDTPFLVVSGNQQGIGKSACVQATGHILSGSIPPPIDFHGTEFMKSVATRFMENDRMVFLDNIVTKQSRGFDNSQLSTLLTQGFSKKIRILGHSKTVSASGILFAASVNEAKLSQDLTTRTLPVKLYKLQNSPMIPFCRDYAIKYRKEIYGELLGLALRGFPPLQGAKEYRAFRFRRWLEFVQPRIEAAFGPLAIEEVSTLDDLTQELFHAGADMVESELSDFTADSFLQFIEHKKEKLPSLYDHFIARIPSQRGRKASVGAFLKVNNGKTHRIGDAQLRLSLVREGSDREGRQYTFLVEQEAPQ